MKEFHSFQIDGVMNRRTFIMIILIFFIITAAIPIPSVAQRQKQSNGISILGLNEGSGVFQGPDQDAIYLKLTTGQTRSTTPPGRTNSSQSISTTKPGSERVLQLDGFYLSDSYGNPMLPYQHHKIALPPEAIPSSLELEVVLINERAIPDEVRIAPAPPPIFDQEYTYQNETIIEMATLDPTKNIVDGYNVLIYEKDSYYPNEYCSINFGGELRKWKVATVTYSPIRYNPVQSNITIAEGMVVKITYEKDENTFKRERTKKLLQDDLFDKRAKSIFSNYDQARDWYSRPLYDGSLDEVVINEDIKDPNYAIITTDAIYSNSTILDDFCFHKQDLGFTVLIVTEHQTHTVEGTTGNYYFVDGTPGYDDLMGEPPYQRPEKIRQWLMDNYLTLGIEYVLLIGNPDPDSAGVDDPVGDIPMRTVLTTFAYELPTDMYYSDLSGDWNMDDDDYIGERYPVATESSPFVANTVPEGVTSDQFCVRWEGYLNVSGPGYYLTFYSYWFTEGQTKIWLDEDKDGFDDDDILFNDTTEHFPLRTCNMRNLKTEYHPFKVEYTQSTGDAYCEFWTDETTEFVHDNGTGIYTAGLVANYYNNNDFSGTPAAVRVETDPKVQYLISGDQGPGGVDFYPEVIVGRIPFYGEDEDNDGLPDYEILDEILSKTIDYETAEIEEQLWRRRLLYSAPYISYPMSSYKTGEYLMDNVAQPPFWDWYRIHEVDFPDVEPDAEVNTGCTIDEFINGWNDPNDPDDGRGVVMWNTHGHKTGAEHVIEQENITDLDDSKPSIVLQGSCSNGVPEESLEDGELTYSIGYSLLRHGAIATISGSRITQGGGFLLGLLDNENDKRNEFMVYRIAEKIFNNEMIGDALAQYREYDATVIEEPFYSQWTNILAYNLYGDPTLSLFGTDPDIPNEMVFVLDGSGSMLLEGKWDTVVDATTLYYDLVKELRSPFYEDKWCCVVFRYMETPYIRSAYVFQEFRNFTQQFALNTLFHLLEPEPGYQTPMGRGLELAVEAYELYTGENLTKKSILLLSDGIHNQGIHPLEVTVPEDIKVYTVGLGLDTIQPEIIQELADASGGDYRITPNPREVEDYFIQILCDQSYKLQDIPVILSDSNLDSIEDTATVTIDQDKAVFISVWDDKTEDIDFSLDPPGDGPNITPTSSNTEYSQMEITYHSSSPSNSHAYYVCNNITLDLYGDWQFTDINNNGNSVPLSDVLLKVVEDPRTVADFEIDDTNTVINQPIILKATMTEDDKPILGLDTVYADLIRSPSVSIGTLLAQNLTINSSIIRLNGPRIQLVDNGTGGDMKADDGVYTGLFTGTTYEGSYTFKFRAKGLNSDNVSFDRMETLSKYVHFAADAKNTKLESVSKVTDQRTNITNVTVRITPKDMFGSYLGPGRGNIISLLSSPKELRSNYTDNNDGSYNFTLSYLRDTDPIIAVSIGNRFVAEKARPLKPPETPVEITKSIIQALEDIELPSDASRRVTRHYGRAIKYFKKALDEFEDNDTRNALRYFSYGVLRLEFIENKVLGIDDIIEKTIEMTDNIVNSRVEKAETDMDSWLDKLRVKIAKKNLDRARKLDDRGREYLAMVRYRLAYWFADRVQ